MKSLRLLLIEDSEDDAMLLELELRKGGIYPDIARVETPRELESALGAKTWDAVIADYSLPEFTGIDALAIIRSSGLDLPFILVSGVIGEERAVEAMKAGAHDFIMKGNYSRLVPALERELGDAAVRRERREADDALRRAHAELEQRVAERTAELQAANATLLESRRAALNMMEDAVAARRQAEEASAELKRTEEELRRAKEAAETANRAKSQFLANMSHELRTPMTGVLGMLEIALDGPLEAQQRECIGIAHKSGRSLLGILNDILDLTKIETDKLSIEDKPFNLRGCVEGAIGILLAEARRKGLDLTFTTTDDCPATLVGDQLRLRQVITNLIANAVKFTEQGKVEVRVDAGAAAANGKRDITFSIIDTGIGIPDDKKGLLFKSFSQVDDSDTRRFGGTGLGLAISREIVELMGGRISFESSEDAGSAFSFTVPLGEAEAELETAGASGTPQPGESNAIPAREGKIPRLLLAEDDPVIRTILETMLVRSNFDLDIAENGRKAVEMWEQGDYDLILMDIQMPYLDGFAATRAIREKERARGGADTLIVAMTAHASKSDEQRCLDAGMNAYVSKPIDLKAVIELLKKMLGLPCSV
ncbi:MAG: response regulator [Deltaproteobacteria bacterium]|nr:response regulator [Deltaproteobacteria bacterium]